MDILANVGLGLQTALEPTNLFYCFVGVALGTIVGVIPGVGPLAAIAMLIPLTFYLDPTAALIMLAGDLVRDDIWWFDGLDPAERARHDVGGGHRARRLSDGATGPRVRCAFS